MIEVVLASRNKKKISELQTLLSSVSNLNVKVLSLDDIGFFGEIEETGTTFEENSVLKASVPVAYGYIGIADDSGLMVDALGGEPGVYSARYSGEGATDAQNNEKLIDRLRDVSEEKRTARFVSVVSCVCPDGRKLSVRGECEGAILHKGRGNGGFGYDPLFFHEGIGKTFAEMNSEEKNSISHRGKAMEKFLEIFPSVISSCGKDIE